MPRYSQSVKCACGCGKPTTLNKYGRQRQYFSDACRKRAQRKRERPEAVEKFDQAKNVIYGNFRWCACGCAERVYGRKKYFSAACKQRAYRERLLETENENDYDFSVTNRAARIVTRECDKCPGTMIHRGDDSVWNDDSQAMDRWVSVFECQRCGHVLELDIAE